jgi:hypothetical protein
VRCVGPGGAGDACGSGPAGARERDTVPDQTDDEDDPLFRRARAVRSGERGRAAGQHAHAGAARLGRRGRQPGDRARAGRNAGRPRHHPRRPGGRRRGRGAAAPPRHQRGGRFRGRPFARGEHAGGRAALRRARAGGGVPGRRGPLLPRRRLPGRERRGGDRDRAGVPDHHLTAVGAGGAHRALHDALRQAEHHPPARPAHGGISLGAAGLPGARRVEGDGVVRQQGVFSFRVLPGAAGDGGGRAGRAGRGGWATRRGCATTSTCRRPPTWSSPSAG